MSKIYAQLDENGIVKAVVGCIDDLPTVEAHRKVELQSFDISLHGKKYENGQFVDVAVIVADSPEKQELAAILAKDSPTEKEALRAIYLMIAKGVN